MSRLGAGKSRPEGRQGTGTESHLNSRRRGGGQAPLSETGRGEQDGLPHHKLHPQPPSTPHQRGEASAQHRAQNRGAGGRLETTSVTERRSNQDAAGGSRGSRQRSLQQTGQQPPRCPVRALIRKNSFLANLR